MYYYLYKITNIINNKIYVGVHKTNNIDDGYMGSGKGIKNAIKKYGLSNFRKDIIEYFDNEELMYDREISIVNKTFLLREDVYNMKLGGPANFYYVNKAGLNHKSNQHLTHARRLKEDEEYKKKNSEKISLALKGKNLGKVPWNAGLTKETDARLNLISEQRKDKIQKGELTCLITDEHAYNISCSLTRYWNNVDKSTLIERNLKISKSLTGRNIKESTRSKLKNKRWVHKDGVSQFIIASELENYLSNGWRLGRK